MNALIQAVTDTKRELATAEEQHAALATRQREIADRTLACSDAAEEANKAWSAALVDAADPSDARKALDVAVSALTEVETIAKVLEGRTEESEARVAAATLAHARAISALATEYCAELSDSVRDAARNLATKQAEWLAVARLAGSVMSDATGSIRQPIPYDGFAYCQHEIKTPHGGTDGGVVGDFKRAGVATSDRFMMANGCPSISVTDLVAAATSSAESWSRILVAQAAVWQGEQDADPRRNVKRPRADAK